MQHNPPTWETSREGSGNGVALSLTNHVPSGSTPVALSEIDLAGRGAFVSHAVSITVSSPVRR